MPRWKIKPTLRYLPAVIAIGIALGVGSYAIGFEEELLKSVVLHTTTSIVIGCSLIFIITNAAARGYSPSGGVNMITLGLMFMAIGVFASELEIGLGSTLFQPEPYQPFSGGGIYLFNGILATILGFGMWHALRSPEKAAHEAELIAPLTTLPVKKGDSILLLPLTSVSLLEAADKYAYVYHTGGDKFLCDYSLAFLEARLPTSFARIHRRHIVNIEHIARIQPFDKKRYTISFSFMAVPSVRSSAGYADKVRSLIKL